MRSFRNNMSHLLLFWRFFKSPSSLPILARRSIEYFIETGRNFPLSVTLSVTSRCNNSCSMCYERSSLNRHQEELTIDEIRKFSASIRRHNPAVFITGGEPFMRKDIMDILATLNKDRLHTGICTNGILLDPERIKKLASFDLDNIIFSIHGDEKSHDKITGKEGNFKKAIDNMRSFLRSRKNTHVMVNFTVLPENVQSIQKVIDLCESTGVDTIRIEHPSFLTKKEYDLNSRNMKKILCCEPEMYTYVNDDDLTMIPEALKNIKRSKIRVLFKPELSPQEMKRWYGKGFLRKDCRFIRLTCFITPTGEVIPCQTIRYSYGNIREQSLIDVYNSLKAVSFRRKMRNNLLPGCSRCCKF